MTRNERTERHVRRRHELTAWHRQDAKTPLNGEALSPEEREEIHARVRDGRAQQSWRFGPVRPKAPY